MLVSIDTISTHNLAALSKVDTIDLFSRGDACWYLGMLCFLFAFSCTRISINPSTTDPVFAVFPHAHSTEARDRQTFWQTCPTP
jgi:hypothetical protein